MQINTTIKNGLPCIAVLTWYLSAAANYRADNPEDYYGYTDVEFELRTRNDKPANWMDKFMSEKDRQRIEMELIALYADLPDAN